jgi:hypothetical protein
MSGTVTVPADWATSRHGPKPSRYCVSSRCSERPHTAKDQRLRRDWVING